MKYMRIGIVENTRIIKNFYLSVAAVELLTLDNLLLNHSQLIRFGIELDHTKLTDEIVSGTDIEGDEVVVFVEDHDDKKALPTRDEARIFYQVAVRALANSEVTFSGMDFNEFYDSIEHAEELEQVNLY